MIAASGDTSRLAARLDELDARFARLANELADLSAVVVPAHADGDGASADSGPPPAYDTLDAWVEDYFAVVFARSVGGEVRWCPQWRDHPEAVTRLEALWRSWETLRLDPNLGIATWLTSYLDPQFGTMMGRTGAFAQCTGDRHVPSRPLPSAPG